MELGDIAYDLGFAAAVGGLLCLDRRGAFQVMVSQPLVALSLLGFMLGDAMLGLWLGAVLQLLWMSSMLFGANTPPNDTLASVSIGTMALLYGKYIGPVDVPLWTLAILLGVPLGPLGKAIDVRLERVNLGLAERALAAAESGRPAQLSWLPMLGLLRVFAIQAVLIAAASGVGLMVLALVHPWLTGSIHRALAVVGAYIVPALGLAVALSLVRRRRGIGLALCAFLAMVLVLEQGGAA